MPTKRETGKERWSRIPKDYFRSRDRIQTLKLLAWVSALVLAAGWWVLGVDWKADGRSSTDGNSLLANHGELNRVHAAWSNKCDACHIPFEPITSASSDKLCMSCHAGPTHHASMKNPQANSCSQCHRDHQGANFSLVRLLDSDCTSCHADLNAHVAFEKKPPGERKYENVARFAAEPKNHPAFQPEAATFEPGKPPVDNSKLKFSHARHMMPGIVKKAGDTPYKIENITVVEERARYRQTADPKEPVQLGCASCHVLDSTEEKRPANPAITTVTLPPRSSGRYYLPATFENSCRACHVLTVVGGSGPLEVPHGVQPGPVADFLKRTISAQVLADDPKVLNAYVSSVKIPGKSPIDPTVLKKRDDVVKTALKSLFPREIPPDPQANSASLATNSNNCIECHYYGPLDPQGIPTQVQPTKVPEIWFTHAAFDHTAHRAVSCRDCHAKAYAFDLDGKTPVADASWFATDYLNPGIDNCVHCHAPARSTGGWIGSGTPSKSTGGVSFDCTECHRYHNGDNRLQGLGASAEEATTIRSISQFLEGTGGSAPKSLKP